jgi:hypothetical protein
MASPATGDGRAKPVWGAPPDSPSARPAPARAKRAAPAREPALPRPRARKAAPTARKAAPATATAAPAARKAGTKAPAARRPPQKRTARRRPSGQFHRRYGVVYATDGPHVRLGVGWFVLALGALVVGPGPTAMVNGATAALAAAQTARAWSTKGPRPSDVMAAAGAGLVVGGAALGSGGAGLGLLGCVALAFLGASGDGSPNPRIADIGWTLQCALAPGLAGMSMVLLARLDQGSAIGLLLLVSAYETGDYLIGSGSANPFEGPGSGAAAIVVITFILSTLPISALSFGQAWVLGGLVALLAPVGQLLASALLPSADTSASGLRRLDSLLLAAPVWAWGVGIVIA